MVLFPKTVNLTNPRLNVLYRVLLVVTIVFLVWKVWVLSEYSRVDSFDGEVSLSSNSDWEKAVEAWPQISKGKLCSSPWLSTMNKTQGDYRSTHAYSEVDCRQPCRPGFKSHECVSRHETTWDDPNSVFLVTAWDEMDLRNAKDPTDAKRPSVTILPFTPFYSIDIEHAYNVPVASWIQLAHDSASEEQDSRHSITTVVVDKDSKEFDRYRPGDRISLTVSTLLGLVGASLDDINHRAKSTDPTYRLSGMSLHLDIFCSDLPQFGIKPADDGLTCYLTVALGSRLGLTSKKQLMNGETGGLRVRNYRGIQISARARGAKRSPDLSTMIVNLATTLVLLNFPKTFVYIVATLLLGHTSRVIRRVLIQKWSASDECASLGMKMLASHSAFDHLKDAGDVISKHQMKKQFNEILADRSDLDELEQESLIEFLHSAVLRNNRHQTQSHDEQDGFFTNLWGRIKEVLELDNAAHKCEDEPTSFKEGELQYTLNNTESVTLPALTKFFDIDYKPHFLESLFMNADIKKARVDSINRRKGWMAGGAGVATQPPLPDEEESIGVEAPKAKHSIDQAEQTFNQEKKAICVNNFSSGPMDNSADQADQADCNSIQRDGVHQQILHLQDQLAHVVRSQALMQKQVDQCTQDCARLQQGLVNDDRMRMDAATQKRLTDLEASVAHARESLSTMTPRAGVYAQVRFDARLDAVDAKVLEHSSQLAAFEGALRAACKTVSPSQLDATEHRLAIKSPMFAAQTGEDIETGMATARQDRPEPDLRWTDIVLEGLSRISNSTSHKRFSAGVGPPALALPTSAPPPPPAPALPPTPVTARKEYCRTHPSSAMAMAMARQEVGEATIAAVTPRVQQVSEIPRAQISV